VDGQVRVMLSEDDADAEQIEALAGLLRADLLQLEVDDVTSLRTGEAPPGSRGVDVAAVGGLLVTLGQSAHGLATVIGAIRAWLARGQGPRRTVRIEIGGDVLELSEASLADQDQLVSLFVSKHTPGKDDKWPVAGP
jgi:hypothetical protein